MDTIPKHKRTEEMEYCPGCLVKNNFNAEYLYKKYAFLKRVSLPSKYKKPLYQYPINECPKCGAVCFMGIDDEETGELMDMYLIDQRDKSLNIMKHPSRAEVDERKAGHVN